MLQQRRYVLWLSLSSALVTMYGCAQDQVEYTRVRRAEPQTRVEIQVPEYHEELSATNEAPQQAITTAPGCSTMQVGYPGCQVAPSMGYGPSVGGYPGYASAYPGIGGGYPGYLGAGYPGYAGLDVPPGPIGGPLYGPGIPFVVSDVLLFDDDNHRRHHHNDDDDEDDDTLPPVIE